MKLAWTHQGDGEWTADAYTVQQLHSPLTDEWTLTLPDGETVTGSSSELRGVAQLDAKLRLKVAA